MKTTQINQNQQKELNDKKAFTNISESDAALQFLKIFEEFESLILPHIQFLLYSKSLLPKELESIYKINLYIQKFHSVFYNLCELCMSGEAAARLISINIENFINAVVDITAKLFPCKSLDVTTDLSDKCKIAAVDIRRTELILYNLISNAIIHNPRREKHIKISTFLRGDYFVITVKDNGKGLPSAEVLKRFNDDNDTLAQDIFFDYQTAAVSHLGVALIKKLAKQMNGKIKYYSTQRGVTAELSIPQLHFTELRSVNDPYEGPSPEIAAQQLAGAVMHMDPEGIMRMGQID